MVYDINPYRSLVADISPTEFEVFCVETLKAYAEKENLLNFTVAHNQHIKAADGTYQIDIWGEYTALGVKNKIIVECKKHSSPLKREVIAELYTKVQSIGANKGIVMSTSGFQSGAVQFAEKHGISLLQIVDNKVRHIVNSGNISVMKQRLELEIERYLPPCFVLEWDCEDDFPYEQVYPTKEMYRRARDTAAQHFEALQ